MRSPWLISSGLLAACYGPSPITASHETPAPARVEIHGRVYDSLTGHPIAGLFVGFADTAVRTGLDGSYRVTVPAGQLTLRVRFGLYEEYRLEGLLFSPRKLDFPLRRLNPALTGCLIAADTVHAVIVDLQGRKTLNRAEGSRIVLTDAAGETVVTAWDWNWRAVDEVTWRARVPTRGRHVDRAVWTLRDQQGFGEFVDCQAVPAPPADLPEEAEPL
jgi:hypothetical protein